MKDRFLLLLSFFLIILLGVLHLLASTLYFYWTLWWFDIFMHFLGGLSIGFFLFWLFQRLTPPRPLNSFKRTFVIIASFILIVGVGWEVFEYLNDISNPSFGETYFQDTLYDLIADIVGAVVAAAIVHKKKLYV